MRSNHLLLFLFFVVFILACNSDDPQPVEPTPSAHAETPLPEVVGADVPSSSASYPDSAFYQPAIFNDLPYQIMYPRNYDSTKSYPIVFFLHGIDERGTDNQNQLRWGASLFQTDSVSNGYPAFVVFPQCPASSKWYDSAMLEKLKGLIDNLVNVKSIDRARIYIEGLSMGAYGTYAMVAKYPDVFAAAVAISGDGDVTKAPQMARAAWKIYGGRKDTIVPGEKSEKMAAALANSGATVSLKIYPNANHVDSWVNAFKEPDYFSWVFSKRKG